MTIGVGVEGSETVGGSLQLGEETTGSDEMGGGSLAGLSGGKSLEVDECCGVDLEGEVNAEESRGELA